MARGANTMTDNINRTAIRRYLTNYLADLKYHQFFIGWHSHNEGAELEDINAWTCGTPEFDTYDHFSDYVYNLEDLLASLTGPDDEPFYDYHKDLIKQEFDALRQCVVGFHQAAARLRK